MGKMEIKVVRKTRRSKVQRAVLGTIAAVGVLSVALVAPNAVRLLRQFEKGIRRKTDPKYAANRAFWRLVEGGYIILQDTPKGTLARLTPRGKRVVSVLDRPNFSLKKPKRWDGKWRVIVFDIKEKRRGTRNRLRQSLEKLGFEHLQKSVWVYPYDCEDLIVLLKADFRIGTEVLYMIVEQMENDGRLRRLFSLG